MHKALLRKKPFLVPLCCKCLHYNEKFTVARLWFLVMQQLLLTAPITCWPAYQLLPIAILFIGTFVQQRKHTDGEPYCLQTILQKGSIAKFVSYQLDALRNPITQVVKRFIIASQNTTLGSLF